MSRAADARAVQYFDALAPEYDAALTLAPNDRLARRAFTDIVLHYAPAGATLLDFGCGTGIDAALYASRGRRVLAYDPSPGMMSQLLRRCATEIAAGQVMPGDTREPFPAQAAAWPAPGIVAANFGVLNMLEDPAELFGVLAAKLASPGVIVVSVLNPVGWRELRTRSWWRGALRHGPSESFQYRTDRFASYVHSMSALVRAAPQFELVGRGTSGAFARYEETDGARSLRMFWAPETSENRPFRRMLWRSAASPLLGGFAFVVFGRRAGC